VSVEAGRRPRLGVGRNFKLAYWTWEDIGKQPVSSIPCSRLDEIVHPLSNEPVIISRTRREVVLGMQVQKCILRPRWKFKARQVRCVGRYVWCERRTRECDYRRRSEPSLMHRWPVCENCSRNSRRVVNVGFRGAPCQGGAFQWVRAPPGEMLQPEATGATVEVTKQLKPSVTNESRNTVTWRVYRP
jgi:hypothetical protein